MIEIFKPIKPWIVTREWGIYDPLYEKFGFSLHNGIDVRIVDKVTKAKAPFDCIDYKEGYQPSGGGLFVGLLSKNEYLFPDGIKCRILVDFLHLHKILVKPGQELKVGDDVAICDNTGAATTGPHLHSQWRRVQYDGISLTDVDKNSANNSFDPTPHFTMYAETYKNAQTILGQLKIKVAELIERYGKIKGLEVK